MKTLLVHDSCVHNAPMYKITSNLLYTHNISKTIKTFGSHRMVSAQLSVLSLKYYATSQQILHYNQPPIKINCQDIPICYHHVLCELARAPLPLDSARPLPGR